jgi:hypothetical protein
MASRLAPPHHMPFIFSLNIIHPRIAVTMKFALTLMMLTLVVLSARVRAAVKSAHMAALNARFSRKNVPRTRNSMILFVGVSDRMVAM